MLFSVSLHTLHISVFVSLSLCNKRTCLRYCQVAGSPKPCSRAVFTAPEHGSYEPVFSHQIKRLTVCGANQCNKLPFYNVAACTVTLGLRALFHNFPAFRTYLFTVYWRGVSLNVW